MFLPDDKRAYIVETISGLLISRNYTNRQLASAAGMLMSISAVVHMAPLYIRKLYQSIGVNKNSMTDNPAVARYDLQCCMT